MMEPEAKHTSYLKNRPKRSLILIWVALAVGGLIFLWGYSNTPGEAGRNIDQWPSNSSITPDKTRDTMVVFLHPKCPCSKASMEEISRLLARYPDAFSLQIVFFQPENESADWSQTSLWETARKLPHTQVILDQGAHEAKLFGAATSGDTYIFMPSGQLRFHGGITPSRGSIGDNIGLDSVYRLAEGKSPAAMTTAVFGCPIIEKAP